MGMTNNVRMYTFSNSVINIPIEEQQKQFQLY